MQNYRQGEHYNRYLATNYANSNDNQYDNNNYSNVYSSEFNQKLSIQREPDIIYDRVDHYLAVSSTDRDITNYPKSNQFTINLPKEFRNIVRMQLIETILPNQNNIMDQPYILLNIKELEGKMPIVANNSALSNAFALIQLTHNTGNFLQIDRKVHEIVVMNTLQPINISKMSISFLDHTGALFDFGTDVGGSFNPLYQNTLIFKITTLEKSRKSLEQRSLF
jgi:hypothetical protein